MTTVTVCRCALVHVVYVTGGALYVFVLTRQWEAGYTMIEMYILPGAGVMTGAAVGTELPVMSIIGGMTAVTIGWRTFVLAIDMAGCTRHADMTARQCETGGAVIEMYILPVTGVMTLGTVVAHLSIMNVRMTGGAVHGCVFEDQVLVAVGA